MFLPKRLQIDASASNDWADRPLAREKKSQIQTHINRVDNNEFMTTTQLSKINLILKPFHYVNGQLNLRCIAQIPGMYVAQSEIQLGTGIREPVPERGKYLFRIEKAYCREIFDEILMIIYHEETFFIFSIILG